MSLPLLCAACGTTQAPIPTTRAMLSGWRSVPDPPGVIQLAPDLSGLRVTRRVDTEALVSRGDVIRTSTLTFATAKDAAEAQHRGAGDDYQGQVERALGAETVGRGPGVGLKLRVLRPTGRGSDVVEVYLLTRGRRLALVELVSARGFGSALRTRVLRLFSRRTAAG